MTFPKHHSYYWSRDEVWERLPLLKRSALFYLKQGMSVSQVMIQIKDSRPAESARPVFREAVEDLFDSFMAEIGKR